MKLLVIVALIVASSLSAGCRKNPRSQESVSKPTSESEAPIPEITSESEEGFHDLVFAIREHKRVFDGAQTILASGTHKGRRVSFEIYLGPGWSASRDADVPITPFRGTVTYRSVGGESDSLLQAMDEIYETRQSPRAMNKATEFVGLSLQGDPRDLSKEITKIKLFFDANDEEKYAELFTNIDLKARKLYISEKDEEYRAAIISALKTP